MKNATEILNLYANGGITLEAANAALKEAKAGYHLEPDGEAGWSEQEMKEGFLPGKPSTPAQRGPDMSRRLDLAGQTVVQKTAWGPYAVKYDKEGYTISAVKRED